MIVYGYTENGKYTRPIECDSNPVRPGEYLVPFNSTHIEPLLSPQEGKAIVWNSNLEEWEYMDVQAPNTVGYVPMWNAALQEWDKTYVPKPDPEEGKKISWNNISYKWDIEVVPVPEIGEGQTVSWNYANEAWDVI